MKKKIAILGSTGSIGTQCLEVIEANSSIFEVFALSAQKNADLLIQQAQKFHPQFVIIGEQLLYDKVKSALNNIKCTILLGDDGLCECVQHPDIDVVLTALVGFAGLKPTLTAIKSGKNIALANKETLVVAGDLVTRLAKAHQVQILPVDSEHSAIFQCLQGENQNPIEKIYLTASGGPFRGKNGKQLSNVTVKEALKHPNWSMGAKITIDSASLMNKGLEVIEAKWLFNLEPNQVEVIVHPQSIIHSIVQFTDGSMKAQMGLPDMKLPIQYAMAYPNRLKSNFERFNFFKYPSLTFESADRQTFRNLDLAYNALHAGGNMPCILNAANEIAVDEFLKERLGFLQMSDMIEECMQQINFIQNPTLEDYFETDKQTRIFAKNIVTKTKFNNQIS